jgi:hypothetical protein
VPPAAAAAAAPTPVLETVEAAPTPMARAVVTEVEGPAGPPAAEPLATSFAFSSMTSETTTAETFSSRATVPPAEPYEPALVSETVAADDSPMVADAPFTAAPTAFADAESDSVPPRPSSFRVVSAAEIDILPPEAPRWEPPPAAESAAPVFRSEYWSEPVEGEEIDFFRTPLKDIQQEQAARAAVEEGSWLEALERDLFGERASEDPLAGTPSRPEAPPPVPQPIETPHPPEEPPPAPQPVRPPERPIEEPLPPQQPITTPNPPEIPTNQAPEVRPERREDAESEADSQGRREPRLY